MPACAAIVGIPCDLSGAPHAMLWTHGGSCCVGWPPSGGPKPAAGHHAVRAAQPTRGQLRRMYSRQHRDASVR
eukprot:7224377-Prymnesium_polylepis.1